GKLKDSYNVDAVAQAAGLAAFEDVDYFHQTLQAIRRDREDLREKLQELGFKIVPSEANVLFAAPPDGDGEGYFRYLRENAVIVRYFPGPVTGSYVRITIGTPEQNAELLALTATRYKKA
ncbi:MAG: aminotransferase class I/II-fold pyridoxal phosphate-dependent enzyme, partial [Lentisphaeria bacterium]|nr:aminotransferase class I/II-fold pyridoxal phosphate-dependent enzyme [Lentisphaeria bacterium]